MKLKTKLTLFTSSFVIILVLIICSVIIWIVNRDSKQELENYRQEAIQIAQEDLKSKVDIVYDLIDREMKTATEKEYIQRFYGQRIQSAIQIAQGILDNQNQAYKDGKISLEQAKKNAIAEIKGLRYDNGTGYIWINDTNYPYPNMIMHPTVPSLDGKPLSNSKWNTALGKNKNLFVSGVELATTQGAGFVDYMWPKPTATGLSAMQPKLSYMSLYKPWNWVIGTGIYVDDVETDTAERLKKTVTSMFYGENGSGYFWINNTETPKARVIAHPLHPKVAGKLGDTPEFTLPNGKNIFTELNNALNRSNKGYAFYDYTWPKRTEKGIIPNSPKSAYVRYYKPLDWVIGSGIYLDQINQSVQNKAAQIEERTQNLIIKLLGVSLAVLIASILSSLIYARGISSSIVKLTNVADDISKGKNMNQDIEGANRKDEIGQLAQAIGRLQTSVNITMKRLMKK